MQRPVFYFELNCSKKLKKLKLKLNLKFKSMLAHY